LCFWNVVEAWTVDDVVRWIQVYTRKVAGTDDSVLPYIDGIKKYGIDGHTLAVLDDDTLCLAGINKVGVRKLILQAVRLLLHFVSASVNVLVWCNSIDTENIQSLCLNICVSANELCNEIRNLFTTNMNKSEGETQRLGSLYAAISRIVDELKNLMNWLDRYAIFLSSERTSLTLFIFVQESIRSSKNLHRISNAINVSCIIILKCCQSIQRIIFVFTMATQLIAKCKDVIRHSNDPLILYTAHIERIYLRRRISQLEWGFDVQSTYLGVHMISNVKLRSPADACRKLDAGDELIQVNGETVIGWDLAKVVEKIHCCSGVTKCSERALNELVLLVKKRPREPWINNISLIERPIADAAVSAECSWRYQLPSTHSTSEHVLNDSDPIDNCERDDSSSSVVSSAISYNVHTINDTSWESDTDDEGITHYLLPARNDQLSTEDGREKGNMVQQLGTVPCEMLDAKQYEGRIRRKHLKEEICGGSVNGKWMKCWMVLRSSLLFVYDNPYAKEADLVIALANFYVSDAPELKTSKK
uniref:Connector enhancer of kinase suppressor of ras (inferred by orthology to a C. elegans protein) n=1 Tax=Anisakis simplex TaxID=6269 RepID=A0A0M3JYW5_ANISI